MANSANSSPMSRFHVQTSAASELATCRRVQSATTHNATWSYVSVGFIADLPPSTSPDGQRACSVVVFQDRLTRQARFLPAPENPSASDVAALFVAHIQGRSGPPKSLLWDRDPEAAPDEAARLFWQQLCLLLHVPASPLPQCADGAGSSTSISTSTSSAISLSNSSPMAVALNRRILEQLIRGHTHHLQDTWPTFLSLAEAAFNGAHPSAISAAAPLMGSRYGTSLLPGSAPGSPRGSMEATAARAAAAAAAGAQSSSTVAVHHFQLREIHLRAQQELQAARARYNAIRTTSSSTGGSSSRGTGDGSGSGGGSVRSGQPSDAAHQPDPQYRVGDQVRLSTTSLTLPNQPATRLRPGFLGPFVITRVISPVAYRLELPPFLARLHPVFHVSRLMPWTESAAAPPSATASPAAAGASPGPPGTPAAAPPPPVTLADSSPPYSPRAPSDMSSPPRTTGDAVVGVSVSQGGLLQPAVMFRIRWAVPRSDGRTEGWEPYPAVARLPAVRDFLRSSEWREWKRSEEAQRFIARWPDRMPRLVRFES